MNIKLINKMKNLQWIVLLITLLFSFIHSQEKKKLFEYGKTHLGLESDGLQYFLIDIWGDMLTDDWGGDVTNLTGVENYDGEDYIDDYWSIQYTIKDKWILRYSLFDINQNMSGPIGPDQGYIIDNGDSPQHNYSYYESNYVGSGKQFISRIISIGYPIKLKTINPNKWNFFKGYQMDLIILLGLSFNTINELDVYRIEEWIGSKVYFWDSYERVDYTETTKNVTPSVGLSVPFMGYFQSSIIYNGYNIKLMIGYGI